MHPSWFLAMVKQCRAEFEDYRASAYLQAEEATRGALVNARGQRAGVDSYSLFMGTSRRAYAYASEELVEYWRSVQRVTFREFKSQWFDAYVRQP